MLATEITYKFNLFYNDYYYSGILLPCSLPYKLNNTKIYSNLHNMKFPHEIGTWIIPS